MRSNVFREIFGIVPMMFLIGFFILMIVSFWRIFEKAGRPGWTCIIPVYNLLVFIDIALKPWWWIFLWFFPYIGFVWRIWTLNMFVKNFGKDMGFTIGCIFLPFIFFPILAFGDAVYMNRYEEFLEPNVLDSNLV